MQEVFLYYCVDCEAVRLSRQKLPTLPNGAVRLSCHCNTTLKTLHRPVAIDFSTRRFVVHG